MDFARVEEGNVARRKTRREAEGPVGVQGQFGRVNAAGGSIREVPSGCKAQTIEQGTTRGCRD